MKKKRTKIIIAILAVVLVLSGTTFAFYNAIKQSEDNSETNTSTVKIDASKKSTENKKTEDKDKKNDQKPTEEDKSNAKQKADFLDKEKETENKPVEKPKKQTLNLEVKVKADQTVFLAKIGNISRGTCHLEIKGNGRTIKRSADVVFTPDFSSCAGFSIPKSELNRGRWTASLSVDSPTHESDPTSTTFEIK